MSDKNKSAHDDPTAFDRGQTIFQRIKDLKADAFDDGHEALVRFLDDLREHMGWPPSDAKARTWHLKIINDAKGNTQTTYDRNFPYKKKGQGHEHACTLEVSHPAAPSRVSIDFKAANHGKAGPGLWTITMSGKWSFDVDLSDFAPPEDALKEAAKHISAALYHEVWNWR